MSKKTERRVHRSRRYWVKAVRDWKESGLTQREFCAERGLAPTSLSRWAGKLGERRVRPKAADVPAVVTASFVEVVAERTESVMAPGPRLRVVVGGAIAEFAELPPPEYIAAIGVCAGGSRC